MEQIADAPWIREAEMYGVGYHKPTEEEYRSNEYRQSIVEGLKKARDLIQQAQAFLEGLPDGTVWEDEIADAADKASNFGFTLDSFADEVERW